ncbi:MAG TPA: tyrosine-type recombinase/integrase [Acidimicrobiales bacterium]|jgi:integrase
MLFTMAAKRRQRGLSGAGTIAQTSSRRWRLRVPIDGRQVTYGTYASEREAADAQAPWRLTHRLPANEVELAGEGLTSVATGGMHCDEWFGRWQEAKRARRSRVRVNNKRGGAESTAARDRACWSKWWTPTIGQQLPHTVTQRDITGIIDSMEVAGLAPLTINTHWGVVKAFFNWLADENVIKVSPIAKASMSVDLVSDRMREIVVPDFRFIEMLSDRLGSGQDRLVFELLLGTGGRRSEVAGMVVGDVDLAAKRVWVRQPVVEVEGRLVRNQKPKGGRNRAVVVGPQLAELLREHLNRRARPPSDAPLLTSVNGAGFRWNGYLSRHLRPVICATAVRWAVGERKRLLAEGMSRSEATTDAVAASLKLKGLTPHHLRHTAAALLWAAGASDIEVQLILGHADVATSKRLYAHLLEGAQDSAAARVEQLREARRTSRDAGSPRVEAR